MSRHLAAVYGAFLVCIPCSAFGQQTPQAPKANTQSPATKSAKATPESVAQSMVKAVKENDHMHPFTAMATDIAKEETDACNRFFDKAQAAAGEKVSGMEGMNVISGIRAYYVARRGSLTPAQIAQKISEYEARFQKIEMSTIDAFHPETQRNTGTKTFVVIALVFHNFLWNGSDWKSGNPNRAITRLKCLPADAMSQWKQAAKDGGISDPEFAPWSLLAVDPLFLNDQFQEAVFKDALPATDKLFHAK